MSKVWIDTRVARLLVVAVVVVVEADVVSRKAVLGIGLFVAEHSNAVAPNSLGVFFQPDQVFWHLSRRYKVLSGSGELSAKDEVRRLLWLMIGRQLKSQLPSFCVRPTFQKIECDLTAKRTGVMAASFSTQRCVLWFLPFEDHGRLRRLCAAVQGRQWRREIGNGLAADAV